MTARARAFVLIVSGIAAGSLLSGPAVAHVGKRIGHLTTHLNPIYLNESQKAADANQLDGLDSTAFLRSTGKATDADLLDGINSTGFLAAAGKAVDADKLDGVDSASFLQGTSTLGGTRSCPGAGFDPEISSTAYSTSTAGERVATAADTFRCAIDLPNGATVSGVTFRVNDIAGGGVVSNCALIRTNLTSAVVEDNVNTPPAATVDGSGVQTLTGPVIAANAVIANGTYGYSLGCDLGTNSGIFGAIVTYSVSASAG